MNTVGIVRDDIYLEHETGNHPESPERLIAIYNMLDESSLMKKLTLIPPRPSSRDELLFIHDPGYIDLISKTSGKNTAYLDADTVVSSRSYDAALLAVGGLLDAVDMVVKGKLDSAFALVRPPGHHAERDRAMGFCLFNNVAIAARYATDTLGLERILIVDWDLHHGNGTQHSFYNDSDALYFSTHQYPYYPGTGGVNEVGSGKGEGFTVNVPLPGGMGDNEYLQVFREILSPIANEYKPQLILLSAGFDIYYQDPLGGMRVTENGFGSLARTILELADGQCGGKVVITLEGGYDLGGLTSGVKAVFEALLREDADTSDSKEGNAGTIIERVKDIQRKYWKNI